MAKKIVEGDFEIACQFFTGLVSQMPKEAKDQLKAEKPEHYKSVFEPTEVTEVVVDPIVT